jgi:hypothetical protein
MLISDDVGRPKYHMHILTLTGDVTGSWTHKGHGSQTPRACLRRDTSDRSTDQGVVLVGQEGEGA